MHLRNKVAPRAGAWIETPLRSSSRRAQTVAPRAGAWIETTLQQNEEYHAHLPQKKNALHPGRSSIGKITNSYLKLLLVRLLLQIAQPLHHGHHPALEGAADIHKVFRKHRGVLHIDVIRFAFKIADNLGFVHFGEMD